MATANTESYQEMISALNQLKSDVGEHCGTLSEAATRCTEESSGDPVAAKASSKIGEMVSSVNQELETVDEVIQYLQQEIERIEEIAQQGESAMD